MLATFMGLVFMAGGVWGLVNYWGDLLIFMRGFLPISFFFGGLTAVIIGISKFMGSKSMNAKPGPPEKR